MRILLTEDEQGIVDFMEKGLIEAGFSVDVARNGKDGARLGRINEYDIILLDFMLPQMNGIDACRAIRKKGIKTPILDAHRH